MTRALTFAAIAEAATGLALILAPGMVGQLLLGADLAGLAATVARVAGIALIGLGIACWPGPPRAGVLFYSTVVALYLAYVGLAGASVGILLWPAVIAHVVLSALVGRDWRARSRQ